MGFISNKEREKTSRKLYKGYGFKKWIIFFTLIIGVICAIYIFIGIAAQAQWPGFENLPNWAFVAPGKDGKLELTIYGVVATVLVCVEMLFGFISAILLLTISSPKTVTKNVNKLISSAIPGRRSGKGVASKAKNRI
ncbi:MAG: hypothetical protein LBT17_03775 [Mycoplasmataceae bacterium]|nr:hypothetical protein [Mycoplasmataceae bacterium]